MIYPTLQQFKDLPREYGRVPVYREIAGDCITPISLLVNFSDEDNLFLLESANLDKSFSRYTFFGYRPRRVISYKNKILSIESHESGISYLQTNPIEFLVQELSGEHSYKNPNMGNFCGGYLGFIGYDLANYMGILREKIREDTENLTMAFFQVDEFYVFDNHMGKLYAACSTLVDEDPETAYRKAAARTQEMAAEVLNSHKKFYLPCEDLGQSQEFDKASFMEAVKNLKNEIISGECIQAVLSNRYEIA
jgi:anthranilate synthase component 1